MTRNDCVRAAHIAAVAMFKPGKKRMADRLQLKLGSPVDAETDGGGWSFTAAREHIEKVLIAEFVKPKPRRKAGHP